MKSREYVKSMILALLIICLFVQFGELWYLRSFALFDSRLPERYEGTLLSRIYNLFSPAGESYLIPVDSNKDSLTPSVIGYAQSGSVTVILGNEQTSSTADKSLTPFLSDLVEYDINNISKSDVAWTDVLNAGGIYADLGRSLAFPIFCGLLGIDSDENTIPVRYIMIARESENIAVYLKGEGDSLYKLTASSSYREQYESVQRLITENGKVSCHFAYTLQKTAADENNFYTGLAPQVLIPDNRLEMPRIIPNEPGNDKTFSIEDINGIIKAFYYNPYNIKKSEQDGTVTYVERYSVVKISGNKFIQYSAVDFRKGIPVERLTDLPASNASHYAEAACAMLERLDKSLTGGDGASLTLWDTSYDPSDGSLRLYFEYTAGGVPVSLTDGILARKYAAVVAIRDNYIYSVALCPRSFTVSAQPHIVMDFLRACQAASLDYPDSKFSDVYLTYDENTETDSGLGPDWAVGRKAA